MAPGFRPDRGGDQAAIAQAPSKEFRQCRENRTRLGRVFSLPYDLLNDLSLTGNFVSHGHHFSIERL